MYYVYILKSEKDGTFYTGMTLDIQKRLLEHNQSVTKTTRARQPWKLIYSESCKTRQEARLREMYWKSGAGREKRNLLQV